MNRLYIVVVLCVALAGGCKVKSSKPINPNPQCPDGKCYPNRVVDNGPVPYQVVPLAEVPVMNLPEHARMKNYNSGSCVCASTISALRWQGQDELARQMREICSGGQSAPSLHAKLERLGIRYAYTTSGDVAFLEWCIRTRRGTGITFFSNHYINLVHLDSEKAVLLDNNRTGSYITLPRDEFIRRWKGYGGWSTCPMYSPAPPLAYR